MRTLLLSPLLVLVPVLSSCGRVVPAAAPADQRDQSVTLATGVAARWLELGDPRGEPVLFLHGYTDTSRSFLGTMQALERLRPELRLVAPDLRGHGGTSVPPGVSGADDLARCFAPAALADDTLALMDHLGLTRAHVVGHSLGSLVGQELALAHPERVDRLVLVASSAHFGDCPVLQELVVAGVVEGTWRELIVADGRAFPGEALALEPRVLPGAEAWLAANWVSEVGADPALLAAILPETASVPLATWLGVPRGLVGSDTRERLAELRAPTLVLAATQDLLFPEDPVQRELCEALARAHARQGTPWAWKRYGRAPLPASGVPDDLGHNFHWSAPEAVARDLAAFLRPGGAPTDEEVFVAPGTGQVTVVTQGAEVLGPRGLR
jgi:pimeloyl-ACP methyl ester carboxylesterase